MYRDGRLWRFWTVGIGPITARHRRLGSEYRCGHRRSGMEEYRGDVSGDTAGQSHAHSW